LAPTSYSDLHDTGDAHLDAPEAIAAGDLVRTGPNLFPHWRVIALDGDRAWLRCVQTHTDGVADLRRCRKVAA
jgi:hypothetical protein